MLGLLGLRIFEATGADIADLGEEHGHRVLRVCGKGTKVVLIPLPPAVGRACSSRSIGAEDRAGKPSTSCRIPTARTASYAVVDRRTLLPQRALAKARWFGLGCCCNVGL
jgi:integrase